MSIDVAIRHRLGDFDLNAAFRSEGRLTAVFGPSGSGKTSLVNVIAGLIRPAFAKVSVGGEVLADTGAGLWPATHRRRIGYVFQDARLFPHLNVRQNLAYGRWFTPREARYAEAQPIIGMLGIEPLLARRPHELSGGEKQRVALGRALMQSPRLLLLDEPLASLDEARKREVMPYIEQLRDAFQVPIIYVSHSVEEVARLATDIAVMEAGACVRFGPAADVMQYLGARGAGQGLEAGSLWEMEAVGYDSAFDLTLLRSAAGEARVQGRVTEQGQSLRLHIKPRDVMIALERPTGISALNVFAGTISSMAAEGRSSAIVTLSCGGNLLAARITRHSCAALNLAVGMNVYAVVKSVSVAGPHRAPAA